MDLRLHWQQLGFQIGAPLLPVYNEHHELEMLQCGLKPRDPHHLFEYLMGMLEAVQTMESSTLQDAGDEVVEVAKLARQHYVDVCLGLQFFIPEEGMRMGYTPYAFQKVMAQDVALWQPLSERLSRCWKLVEKHFDENPGDLANAEHGWLAERDSRQRMTHIRIQMLQEQAYCQLSGFRVLADLMCTDNADLQHVDEVVQTAGAELLLEHWMSIPESVREALKHATG